VIFCVESCSTKSTLETKTIASYEIYIRGRNFALVDTPGFDDEDLTDSDVLKLLVDWLASTYRSGQKLSGILYLHRIADTRMRGSSMRNLSMFKQLVGDDFYKNVTLGTTCWSLVPFHVGLDRENELKSNSNFWKMMISKEARLKRIPDDVITARELVYEIASNDAVALKTQRDVVDLGIRFSNLAVTKTVNHELEELRRQQQTELKRLEEAKRRQLAQQARQAEEAREQRENEMKNYKCSKTRDSLKLKGGYPVSVTSYLTEIFSVHVYVASAHIYNSGRQAILVGCVIGTGTNIMVS
jgi:hypothetical protein